MNKDLKKILIQQGIDTAGRLAGNYLLDSLTREGEASSYVPKDSDYDKDQDYFATAKDRKGSTVNYEDLKMKAGQSDSDFRSGTENLTPRFRRSDLPEGFGAQTVLGPVVENPSEAAIYARTIAPYAGMAATGTALNYIFGGKPSSKYKTSMGNRRSDGKVNQNILATNTKSRNDESLELMKFQHAIDLQDQKAKITAYENDADFERKQMAAEIDFARKREATAGSPLKDYLSILEYESLDRQGMLGVEKDIARSIFGTGVRL